MVWAYLRGLNDAIPVKEECVFKVVLLNEKDPHSMQESKVNANVLNKARKEARVNIQKNVNTRIYELRKNK